MNNHLHKQTFPEKIDQKVFGELLACLNHVTPQFITREEYNKKQGNILEQTNSDKHGPYYELFLPKDLKYGELLQIINTLTDTFGLETDRLESLIGKVKIFTGVILRDKGKSEGEALLNSLKTEYNISENFIDTIKEAQKPTFSEIKGFVKDILQTGKEKKCKINTENTSETLSKTLNQDFDNVFFRKSMNMIRHGLMTLTKSEFQYIQKKKKKGIKGEKIITENIKENDLEAQEKLLREKIGIDIYKKELKELRKGKNIDKIAKKEKEATNKIIDTLYFMYPYQSTKNGYGYQPSKILKHKEVYCVGYSLIGHAFLSELEIKHKGLSLSDHSALQVLIGRENYYFDPTASSSIDKFDYNEKKGIYKEIKFSNATYSTKLYACPGPIENILLAQICNNKGSALSNLGKYEEAIKMYDKVIELNPNNASAYTNKGNALGDLGKYEEAIKMYDKAIKQDSKYAFAYNTNKGNALGDLGKYEEAIKMYDKAIKQDSKYAFAYNHNKGNALSNLGKYEEAIKMYDKAIKQDSKFAFAYNNKGNALNNLGKKKQARLHWFVSKQLKGKKSLFKIRNRKEKSQIQEYIKQEDYENLRKYILEL